MSNFEHIKEQCSKKLVNRQTDRQTRTHTDKQTNVTLLAHEQRVYNA